MNTPNKPSVPLSIKIALFGGGLLVILMLGLTARSIINLFLPAPGPDVSTTALSALQPNPSEETTPATPENLKPDAAADRPSQLSVQVEIAEQRRIARAETIEALKREAQERAGTSGVPKEVLRKIEQSDPIIY